MKKIYALLTALVISLGVANAQYYYIPYQNAGTNPGGLNTEVEYPVGGGLATTWSNISGMQSTPKWSSLVTLPFTFQFNGTAYTSCKVSTSGVLTFTTGATAVPPFGAVALPSANVPDNSVCILGIRGTGANDSIVTQTFGTTPNQQTWFFFTSYSTATAGAYTYWSIVLEEGSNNIYIVDQRHNTTVSVSAGIQINSSTAISVAGSPALASLAGADPSPADNSYYQFIYGTQASDDAKLKTITADQYVVVPGTSTIAGEIQNLGANTINNIAVKYLANGSTYTDNLTGLNIASGTTGAFTHSIPFNVTSPVQTPIKVWVELTNDANQANDTLTTTINGLSYLTTKRVLIEEATGTWCGWCPRGAVYTEQIDTVHLGTAVVVAVHNSDPMTNVDYDAGMNGLISGYPSGLVDRKSNDIDPTNFETVYNERILDVSPADVGVAATFTAGTRQVDVTVSATFAATFSADLRLNAILVEDDVTGTTSTYAQTNYYSSTSQNLPLVGAGHNWQTSTNPIPAAQMHYNFVGRELMGGFDGQAGSLPGSFTASSTYTYTFSTTIPSTWDETKIRVVGVLQDVATGNILNVRRGGWLVPTGFQELKADNFSMSMYPNPTDDFTQLSISLNKSADYTIEMVDVLGQTTYSQSLHGTAGKNVISIPVGGLRSGMYMVHVNVNGSILTSRLMVK